MITLTTYAKLNCSLRVFSPNKKGYHPICSIFQSISLADKLHIQVLNELGFTLESTDKTLSLGADNLLTQLYNKFSHQIPFGISVKLEKHIPQGGGVGGGSANAGAFLSFLNDKCGWELSRKQLIKHAQSFGADIPFCLTGGTALVRGTGEVITPISPPKLAHYIIILPHIHASTQKVFQEFDRAVPNKKLPTKTPRSFLENYYSGNDLKPMAFSLYPKLKQIETLLKRYGIDSLQMSGSGSTCFIPFATKQEASRVKDSIETKLVGCSCVLAKAVNTAFRVEGKDVE